MSRKILEGEPARRAIARGAEQLARAVRVTLGPRGRTVLVERGLGGPSIMNDGSTVAYEVELPDPFENLGARLLREAARKTFDDAGDGTTTATVLAQSILAYGFTRVAQGAAPIQLKRGIELAARAASAHVRAQARPLTTREERLAVAAIGAKGDLEAARMVEDALHRVGPGGAVSIRAGQGRESRLDFAPGQRFESGYLSAYFVTSPGEMRALLDQPLLLLADQRLERAEEVASALGAAQSLGVPLLVIAQDIEGEALRTLVLNQLRGVARSCAVQAPGTRGRRRAWLEELAAATGATLFAPDLGRLPEQGRPDDLGRLERALVERGSTTLVFREDLPATAGGVAVIEVGGASEGEIEGARARFEDALAALSSALADGIVPGGGVALVRARDAALALPLEGDARAGAEALALALLEPARWIAQNSGADGDRVVAALLRASGATGYDALLGEMVDMDRAGVVDPARVVLCALENAAAVAGLLLATETLVVEEEEGDGRAPEAPEAEPD